MTEPARRLTGYYEPPFCANNASINVFFEVETTKTYNWLLGQYETPPPFLYLEMTAEGMIGKRKKLSLA